VSDPFYFSFDSPPLTKTVILHLPNVDNGTAWAYGPIMPYEAFDLFEEIISWTFLDIPIAEDEMVYFDETEDRKL